MSACLPRIHVSYRYDIHIYMFAWCILCYMVHYMHILHMCFQHVYVVYMFCLYTWYMCFTWHFCFLHVLCGLTFSLQERKGKLLVFCLAIINVFFAILGSWTALTSFWKYRPLGALFSGINHEEEGVTWMFNCVIIAFGLLYHL